MGVTAVLQLLFTPFNNWSWVQGLSVTMNNLQNNKGATLGTDLSNTASFASVQLLNNIFPAALTGIGAAITYKLGKMFGL